MYIVVGWKYELREILVNNDYMHAGVVYSIYIGSLSAHFLQICPEILYILMQLLKYQFRVVF